jgi:hypothetical protein
VGYSWLEETTSSAVDADGNPLEDDEEGRCHVLNSRVRTRRKVGRLEIVAAHLIIKLK